MYRLIVVLCTSLAFVSANTVLADDNVRCVQQLLTVAGLQLGPIDGAIGAKTRDAAAQWLSSQRAPTSLPPFSTETAREWRLSSVLHQQARPAPRGITYIFGGDVPQRVRDRIVRLFDNAQTFYQRSLGLAVPNGTKIVASADAEFLARAYVTHTNSPSSYDQSVRNWTSLRENEALFGAMFIRTNSRSFLDANNHVRIVSHELFHILQYDLVGERARNCCGPNNRIPVVGPIWLMEGAAQYFMQRAVPSEFTGWLSWARGQRRSYSGGLAALETREGMQRVSIGYEVGALAVHALVSKAGDSSLKDYWSALGSGLAWEAAFEQAFGESVAAFYSSF